MAVCTQGNIFSITGTNIVVIIIKKKLMSAVLFVLAFLFFTNSSSAQQTIQIKTLTKRPDLDGSDRDWRGIAATFIPLKRVKGKTDVKSVSLKAGVYGEEVYFLIQWKDATKDVFHKPFIWNDAKGRYIKGPQMEDRFAFQFSMNGDYTADWLSGNAFQADMWHWKAHRTNPNGIMHDKMTIITKFEVRKSLLIKAKNGKSVYLRRPSDKGTRLYKTLRYPRKQKDIMPRYVIAKNPVGSVADVRAKGVWKNDMWTLEIQRKLNTGNPDDVVFVKGRSVKGGIAIFNHSENENHDTSKTLIFRF